ncbi:MAG: hypothetical protein CBB72_005410 [Muricauda sp. TMED12]|nr:MAG: hypothetical protein CBB72_005410 [Muricauda sp. TMED12]|tara:strand:+ start:819 stop:1220 length:402 start_codon:yes stop_codon:yes gene_type:complete
MEVNKIKFILFMSISLGIWVGCKSVSPVATSTNYGIIGSWEGCDGRVVTFSADENGKITGRYTKLGGLGRYKFTLNEVGFHLSQESPGVYVGQVKWKNTNGKETWRDETIVVENNMLKTSSSDDCSKELAKVE